MNIADLLTLTSNNIDDNRIVYRRKKTGKVYSIKIHEYAKYLLELLSKDSTSDFILPEVSSTLDPLSQKNRITQVRKNCNTQLKKIAFNCSINKPVTTYYARYTWVNIARKLGYSKDLIAEALGHRYGNKVTGIYLEDYDKNKIDEMNSNVIEHVLNNKGVH